MSYIAFFDLDHTLINANSGKLLLRLAYRRNKLKGSFIAKALWQSFLHSINLKKPEKIVSGMVGWIGGVPESEFQELILDLFENQIKRWISEGAQNELSFHRERNATIIILSSSLTPICRAVAEYLQMNGFICTDPEVRDGIFTGSLNRPVCIGEEKAKRLIEYCEEINASPDRAWYYGDSYADFPALNIVGHPVCVNPDKQLRKAAVKKGWDIKYWI